MRRPLVTALAVAGLSISAAACDDDDSINEDIEDQVVDPDTTTADGVPFDPEVPGGVETDTAETENQGFDDDDTGTGNQSDPNTD